MLSIPGLEGHDGQGRGSGENGRAVRAVETVQLKKFIPVTSWSSGFLPSTTASAHVVAGRICSVPFHFAV